MVVLAFGRLERPFGSFIEKIGRVQDNTILYRQDTFQWRIGCSVSS